jgi:hypothetical protein
MKTAIRSFILRSTFHNDIWGPLFGYSGSFDVESIKFDGQVPEDRVPARYEGRE